ncbi:MAG TPA: phosphotransferase [Herpetosiphonaceae bacterium]
MREPSPIPVETLRAAALEGWGVRLEWLEFLPLGADPASWVYRGETADGPLLVKLRGGQPNEAGLALPRALRDAGLEQIVAPLAGVGGRLWVPVADARLMLYPFIAGRPGAEGGQTTAQWREFGALVRRLHDAALPPAVAALLAEERLEPAWEPALAGIAAAIEHAPANDEIGGEFRAIWRERQPLIDQLRRQAAELADELRRRPAPLAVCHADLHTWNTLIDDAGRLWLIDWDTAVLARRERDLMFVVGGIAKGLVSPADTEAFFAGYGPAELDPAALAYYRHAWALQDIAGFSEELAAPASPDGAGENRRAAFRWLKGLFEPGEIVSIALGSERAPRRFG